MNVTNTLYTFLCQMRHKRRNVRLYLLLLFFAAGIPGLNAANYYWVGGSGNWSDLTHWATSSGGGLNHIIVPSPNDNVIFDANSGFSPGNNTVTTNTNVYCYNMVWNNAPAAPVFNESNTNDFFVFGSLTLQTNLTFNARVYFTGDSAAVITSNGCWIQGAIEIDKTGSSVTLADDLVLNYKSGTSAWAITGDVALTAGTFNLNGFDLYANAFYSSNNNVRHVNMAGSTLWFKAPIPGLNNSCTAYPYSTANTSYVFTYTGNNKTVSAANSLIRQSSGCNGLSISGGTQLSFHNFWVDFNVIGYSSTIGNSIFNLMTTNGGCYQISSSSGAQVDSMLFNTVTASWLNSCNNLFSGAGTTIGTLIFNGINNQPTVYYNGISGSSNTIGRLEFRNYEGRVTGSSNTIAYAEFFDNGYITGNNNTFSTLVFAPGYIYRMQPGTNTTITGNWYGSGNPCYLTEIVRTSTSGTATITKNGSPVNLDYVRVNGITAAGTAAPFLAGIHSINLGANTNWNFSGYNPGAPIYGLGPDTMVCPSLYPITLNTSGFLGAPSTTYTWSDGSTGNTFMVYGPGTYWVSADYGRSCIYTDSIVVTDRFTVNFSGHVPVCDPGNPGGSVTAVVSGTSGPYTYSWNTSPVQTGATATGLSAGTYTVSVTDALGCTYQDSTSIAGPSTGTAFSINIPAAGIFPDCDPSASGTGAAAVVASGGSGPYTYSWNTSPVQTSASVYNLNAGTYQVKVTDANGCADSAMVTINGQFGSYSGSVQVVNPAGCDTVGNATVLINGGLYPYTYTWTHNPAETDSIALNVPVGAQSVTVVDSNKCLLYLPFQVTGADSVAPVFSGCPSDITVSVTPGTCSAAVSWVPPAASDSCGVVSLTASHNPGTVFPLGTTTVYYIATDKLGNKDTCRFQVTVLDTQAPNFIVCPQTIVKTAAAGNCSATATWAPPTATDNCGGPVSVVGDFSSGTAFPVGTTTVTYIATDASGNKDTCSFKVIIRSNPADFYLSSCSGDQGYSVNPSNSCTRTLTLNSPIVNNLCGNYVLLPDSFAPGQTYSFPVGVSNIVHRYTNTADTLVCNYRITIYDYTTPSVSGCPGSLSLQADTCGGRRVSWTPPVFTDNCGINSVSSNFNPGDFFPTGTTQVIYTATDFSGNTRTCSFNININDLAPVISGCPSNILVTADTCGGRRVSWNVPSVTDNCLTSFTSNYQPGAFFPVGTTTVTYVALSANGAQTTCSFQVTVNPYNPAISGCPASQVINLDSVTCAIPVSWTPPVFTHPCGIASVTSNYNPGDTLLPGVYTILYTATSNDGFVNTCSFGITVNAFAAPITVSGCPPNHPLNGTPWYMQQVDTTQFCGEVIAALPVPSFSTSYCSPPVDTVILSSAVHSGDTVAVGTYPVSYTAYDSLGNVLAQCVFTYEVLDTLSDVMATGCPVQPVVLQINPAVYCGGAIAAFTPPQFISSGCAPAIDTIMSNIQPGDTLTLGIHTVYYDAYDSLGNVLASCSFGIQVSDTVSGITVSCPPTTYSVQYGTQVWNMFIDTTTCKAVANWPVPVFTPVGCAPAVDTVYSNYSTGDSLGIGTYNVQYNAYDAAGTLLGSCSFLAVVQPAPGWVTFPADTVIATDPVSCLATVNWNNPFVTGTSCGTNPGWYVNSYSNNWWQAGGNAFQNNVGQQLPVGTYTISYNAYNGPSSILHTFTLQVVDGSQPTFGTTCPAGPIVINTEFNTCGGVAQWPLPVASSGSCGGVLQPVTLTSNYDPGDLLPPGNTNIVYTATSAGGITATCSFTVTVVDAQAPEFYACPQDIVLDAAAGSCTAVAAWAAPSVFDNCPGAVVTASHIPGTAFPVGVTQVLYTVSDASGNTDTCRFSVTVQDHIAPVFSGCPSGIVQGNDPGQCGAAVSWTAPVANDNCSGVTLVASHLPGSVFMPGTTLVTYTATDSSGNSSVCSFPVTVNDMEQPVISNCPQPIIQANDPGQCSAVVTWTAPVAADNCGSVALSASHSPGTLFPVGTTTVTYTATDLYGNSSTCSFSVTVTDTEQPVAQSCPAGITLNADYNTCTAVANWTPPVFTDNCAGLSIVSSHAPGMVFPLGSTPVTYTATDAGGNITTCSFTVTVNDMQNPVVVNCPSDITVNGQPGSCGAVVSWNPATAIDNCSGVILQVSHASGSLFPVGITTVTYTATDAAGNAATCSFHVTVNDTEPPVISNCPSGITLGNDAGQCSAVANWTAPTASDNCGGTVTVNTSHTSGTAFPLGTTIVTYTFSDGSGNSSQCSFPVTVNDTEAPVASGCPADIQSCKALVSWTPPVFTDNCAGPVQVSSNYQPGVMFPAGTTTVTYTATDAAGNSATCSFQVRVSEMELLASSQSSCAPSETVAAVEIIGGVSPFSYSWSNGSSDSVLTGIEPGTYSVTVTDAAGCAAQAYVVVQQNKPLQVVVDKINPSTCGNADGSVLVQVNGGVEPYLYMWSNGSTASELTNVDKGSYTLHVTDAANCKDSLLAELGCEFRIPQLVTPNGDGHNDTWKIPGIEQFPEAALQIFNRWGNEVYSSMGYQNTWSGESTGGGKYLAGHGRLPAGTYFYVLKLSESEIYSGYLELQY